MLVFYFNIFGRNKANTSQLLPYNLLTIETVAFDCTQIHSPTNIPTPFQLAIFLHIKGMVQLKTFKGRCPYTS